MMQRSEETSYGIVPVYMNNGTPEFLLVRQRQGHWSFPKGHPEAGETPLQAALRELNEECGINDVQVFPEHMFTLQYVITETNVLKTNVLFLGLLKNKNVVAQESEVVEWRFVTEKDAVDLRFRTADAARIIAEVMQALKDIV